VEVQLGWGRIAPRAESGNPAVLTRLHEGEKGAFLWIINPSRDP